MSERIKKPANWLKNQLASHIENMTKSAGPIVMFFQEWRNKARATRRFTELDSVKDLYDRAVLAQLVFKHSRLEAAIADIARGVGLLEPDALIPLVLNQKYTLEDILKKSKQELVDFAIDAYLKRFDRFPLYDKVAILKDVLRKLTDCEPTVSFSLESIKAVDEFQLVCTRQMGAALPTGEALLDLCVEHSRVLCNCVFHFNELVTDFLRRKDPTAFNRENQTE